MSAKVGIRIPSSYIWWQWCDVWFFTKTLPFVGVVRYFSTISTSLSCCFLLLYNGVLRSVHPRSPRAAVSEKEAAVAEMADRHVVEGAAGDVLGWEDHPPYPFYL